MISEQVLYYRSRQCWDSQLYQIIMLIVEVLQNLYGHEGGRGVHWDISEYVLECLDCSVQDIHVVFIDNIFILHIRFSKQPSIDSFRDTCIPVFVLVQNGLYQYKRVLFSKQFILRAEMRYHKIQDISFHKNATFVFYAADQNVEDK